MNFVNPWLSLMSFVYFIFAGFISFVISKKFVNLYLEKVQTKLLKSLEPIVGTVAFCGSFGLSLIILYYILT
tara:strand:- start:135 stop:350 length:216 start_codon:yes stop_codon:yes gene_type:complete